MDRFLLGLTAGGILLCKDERLRRNLAVTNYTTYSSAVAAQLQLLFLVVLLMQNKPLPLPLRFQQPRTAPYSYSFDNGTTL
jgi:hypothetical protein